MVLVLWDSQQEAGDSVGLVRTGACHDLELLQVLHREQVGSQGEGHHRLGGRRKGRGGSQVGGHHEPVVHRKELRGSQVGWHQVGRHKEQGGNSQEEGLQEEEHHKKGEGSLKEGLHNEQEGSQVGGHQKGGHRKGQKDGLEEVLRKEQGGSQAGCKQVGGHLGQRQENGRAGLPIGDTPGCCTGAEPGEGQSGREGAGWAVHEGCCCCQLGTRCLQPPRP